MPFQIIREKRGVHKKFSGFVSKAEFLRSVFANQSDPDYDRMAYSINDFLDVTGYGVESADVKIAATYALGAEFTNSHLRIAVVSTDQKILDLLGGFTALTHYQLEIFSTLQDARMWLELSEYV
jgi:hypothetical protein